MSSAKPFTTRIIGRAVLAGPAFFSDSGVFFAHRGSWAFYVRPLGLKLLYARDGMVDCRHRRAPDRDRLFNGHDDAAPVGRYSAGDWKAALSKAVRRRAVENFIAARRLFEADLGPEPYGLCYVRQFRRRLRWTETETAGIFIQDIHTMPTRPAVTRDQMLECGVMPDRIGSSLRQQIRGYVSDLNSVCGVMPLDADDEIDTMVRDFERHIKDGNG